MASINTKQIVIKDNLNVFGQSPLVVILRGVPGSGKSTLIKNFISILNISDKDIIICSADNFFMKKNNKGEDEYIFNGSKIKEAHLECKKNFNNAIKEKKKKIIFLDNTNIKFWEYKDYLRDSSEFLNTLLIEFRIIKEDINKVLDRNVHGVPNDKILQMYNNFQYFDYKRLPYYIKKNSDRINFQALNAFNCENELKKMIVNLQIKNWI